MGTPHVKEETKEQDSPNRKVTQLKLEDKTKTLNTNLGPAEDPLTKKMPDESTETEIHKDEQLSTQEQEPSNESSPQMNTIAQPKVDEEEKKDTVDLEISAPNQV